MAETIEVGPFLESASALLEDLEQAENAVPGYRLEEMTVIIERIVENVEGTGRVKPGQVLLMDELREELGRWVEDVA